MPWWPPSSPTPPPLPRSPSSPHLRRLGYTMQVDEGEKMLMSRTELENKLATLTGGRAAEELIFGPDNMTTGASNDIEQATKLARA